MRYEYACARVCANKGSVARTGPETSQDRLQIAIQETSWQVVQVLQQPMFSSLSAHAVIYGSDGVPRVCVWECEKF